MNEFRYLSYCTIYSCKGSKSIGKSERACFAYIFRDNFPNKFDISYKIIIYPNTRKCKNGKNNYCLLTKDEIRNHLRRLRSIYPLHYKVTGDNLYTVYIRLKDVPQTFHKYVLTWLRYTYEYPYNVILKDVCWLKKDSQFRFVSTATLFNVVARCFPSFVEGLHSIAEHKTHIPTKIKDLRKSIDNNTYLGDLYKYATIEVINKIPRDIKDFNIYDVEYWDNEEWFNQYRKKFYIDQYNKIKRL